MTVLIIYAMETAGVIVFSLPMYVMAPPAARSILSSSFERWAIGPSLGIEQPHARLLALQGVIKRY